MEEKWLEEWFRKLLEQEKALKDMATKLQQPEAIEKDSIMVARSREELEDIKHKVTRLYDRARRLYFMSRDADLSSISRRLYDLMNKVYDIHVDVSLDAGEVLPVTEYFHLMQHVDSKLREAQEILRIIKRYADAYES